MPAPAGARTRGISVSVSPELSYYRGSRSCTTCMAASSWTTATGHGYTLLTPAEIFHPFASFSFIRGNSENLLHDSDASVVITIAGNHGKSELMYIKVTHKHAVNTSRTNVDDSFICNTTDDCCV